jgi:hypothetical protein
MPTIATTRAINQEPNRIARNAGLPGRAINPTNEHKVRQQQKKEMKIEAFLPNRETMNGIKNMKRNKRIIPVKSGSGLRTGAVPTTSALHYRVIDDLI